MWWPLSEVLPTRPTKARSSAAAQGPGLCPDERRAWSERGFFVRPAVFAGDEIAALRLAAGRVEGQIRSLGARGHHYRLDGLPFHEVGDITLQYEPTATDTGGRNPRVVEPCHHLDPHFEALVDDARLVAPMQDLASSAEVALFTDKLNFKGAGGSAFSWHQDSPYWLCLGPRVAACANVMLALDDADESNGCFRVIEGSHTQGILPGRPGSGVLDPLFTHPDAIDQSRERAVPLPAGSLVFFHPHLVHGSRPNRGDARRRALVLTYQTANYPMLKRAGIRNAGATSRRSSAS